MSTQKLPSGPKNKRVLSPRKRHGQAWRIVYRHMMLSSAAGLIPAPLFDQVVIGGLLGKMLCDLFALYGIKATQHKVKTIITAVLGGAHSEWITRYVLGYLGRYAPGSSRLGIIVARPLVAAATTYAVGLLFVHHLDRGAWPARETLSGEPLKSLISQ